jgi:hypothetical protein
MNIRIRKALSAFLMSAILLCGTSPANAGWEAGTKAGYESNLSRSIDDGEGSGYLSAYGAYEKGHAAETRLDWTLGIMLQGAAYPSLSDVDYTAASLSPGLAYIFRPGWTAALTPFLLMKAVRDSEQSALAFGGRVDLSQRFRNGVYLGEYYAYTDSRAREGVYSYTENAVGAVLGMRWTSRFYTEAGYEFSRGDSFLSVKAPASSGGGGGFGRGMGRFTSTFGAEVFKESVDSHAFSVSAGIDWTRSWFTTVNYTYRKWDGDASSATGNSGFAGIGYRF